MKQSITAILQYFVLFSVITGMIAGHLACGADTLAVTDLLGRSMVIPVHPMRVISLAPNITEIVFALGEGSRLVGVTTYSNYPADAEHIPKVGSYVRLDIERIVSLSPDLCLAIKDGNPKEAVTRLESLGIPVYAVDPRNLESVMETLIKIGHLLGADGKARLIVKDMRDRIHRIENRVHQTNDRPRVFFQIGISPIVSVGSQTFIHKLIEQAGGRNVAEGPVPYPRFSKEQVLGLSPEVIIITSMARDAVFDQLKAEWRQWTSLPAVRNNRIFIQESDLFDRPSPRLVDALEVLARLIHPELFEESR
jgi:iron complex transport system substrate-binding protein